MQHKVLIADDSLTIQKVVKITLSGENYEMLDCDETRQLYEIVEAERPSVVFLDFSLSEGVSGYEVTKKIIKLSSDTKVMIMFGTFDNIDEDLYARSGASAKITKPFDGQKFITLCHQLLEGQEFFGIESDGESLEAVEKQLGEVTDELNGVDLEDTGFHNLAEQAPVEITEDDIDNDINWELDDSSLELGTDIPDKIESDGIDDVKETVVSAAVSSDQGQSGNSEEFDYHSLISTELEEWGMSVPDSTAGVAEPLKVINTEIEEAEEVQDIAELESEKVELSAEITEKVNEIAAVFSDDEVEEALEFSPNEDGELEADELIDFDSMVDVEEDPEVEFDAIEKQIETKLDHTEAADLWSVDEVISSSVLEDSFEPIEEEVVAAVAAQHIEVSKETVEDVVRAYMNEHGKSIVEKIAWEMIPDLAENIIRDEVKDLAEKVLKDKS